MELSGSKTEKNLMAAFGGESQARNKYTFYADVARKNGYQQIADIFEETASNEKAHAKIWFKYLKGDIFSSTTECLLDAARGEHYEWFEMYKEFAETAKEEGFDEISATMSMVADIEKSHEERFLKLAENIKTEKVFEKEEATEWLCRNCGRIHRGKKAPDICPVCKHEKSYFEVKAENY